MAVLLIIVFVTIGLAVRAAPTAASGARSIPSVDNERGLHEMA